MTTASARSRTIAAKAPSSSSLLRTTRWQSHWIIRHRDDIDSATNQFRRDDSSGLCL
jgi:hypothetical protein